jgi:putative flavoprotein involved in K+ transport
MSMLKDTQRIQTLVIGGGQAGLSVGYHLARRGLPFLILDANERVGDSWRKRWDSLRLFTPARFDALDGMPFPTPPGAFITKDEMADYLEGYAAHFGLPVRSGVEVDSLTREGDRFVVSAGCMSFEADNVVVAMSNYQQPRVPEFADQLDPGIVQLHSSDYRNQSQLRDGDVLIVGAGNSGAEIAVEAARIRRTLISGKHPGHVPFQIDGFAARILLRPLFRVVFHRLFTADTSVGRKVRRKMLSHGMPLIRVKPSDLARARIERVPRVVGVSDGKPLLEDGRVLDVANVVWCTGFQPGFSWIDLAVFADTGEPRHVRGVVPDEPGLYFVGLHFLYAASSAMVHGVGRDAEHVVKAIASSTADGGPVRGEARMDSPETVHADGAKTKA